MYVGTKIFQIYDAEQVDFRGSKAIIFRKNHEAKEVEVSDISIIEE